MQGKLCKEIMIPVIRKKIKKIREYKKDPTFYDTSIPSIEEIDEIRNMNDEYTELVSNLYQKYPI